MNRYVVGTLVGLVLAPLAASAQQDPAARIEAAKERAAAAGIPVELLQSRVAEGRAKGVPMDRIATAVERRAAALEQAREAMSRSARDLSGADLAAGADAVEAGIDGSALRTVIEQARAEDRPVAIAVLTYLHRDAGVPVDKALTQVTSALSRGPDALRDLPAQAAAAAGRRGPPEGVGGRPQGVGGGKGAPSAVPGPGQKPAAGKPDGVGRPDGKGKPGGTGRAGGKPGGGV